MPPQNVMTGYSAVEAKPSIVLSFKCDGDLGDCFEKLREHFRSHVLPNTSALTEVYGVSDPEVERIVEMAATWGLNESRSTFIFFKPVGSTFQIHVQGFGAVKTLMGNRDWLEEQVREAGKKTGIKLKVVDESLNARASFKPRKLVSFFGKEMFLFLFPFIVFLAGYALYYYSTKQMTNDALYNVYVSLATLILWGVGTGYMYLRKRKTFVLELPQE